MDFVSEHGGFIPVRVVSVANAYRNTKISQPRGALACEVASLRTKPAASETLKEQQAEVSEKDAAPVFIP